MFLFETSYKLLAWLVVKLATTLLSLVMTLDQVAGCKSALSFYRKMLLHLKTSLLEPVCHFKQIRLQSSVTSFHYNITGAVMLPDYYTVIIKGLESKAVGSSGLSVSLGAVKYTD